jgi:hypothetical protein
MVEQAVLTARALGVQMDAWSNQKGLVPLDVMRAVLDGE